MAIFQLIFSWKKNHKRVCMFQVSSRPVFYIASIIMILFGIIGKFGALFATIPHPVIGGVFIVMFGMF